MITGYSSILQSSVALVALIAVGLSPYMPDAQAEDADPAAFVSISIDTCGGGASTSGGASGGCRNGGGGDGYFHEGENGAEAVNGVGGLGGGNALSGGGVGGQVGGTVIPTAGTDITGSSGKAGATSAWGGGGGGGGGAGLFLSDVTGEIRSNIRGGSGGLGDISNNNTLSNGGGGGGGAGVLLLSSTVKNYGTISGGAGGLGNVGAGSGSIQKVGGTGAGGDGVYLIDSSSLENHGAITGGEAPDFTNAYQMAGLPGSGIRMGSQSHVINAGTIAAGEQKRTVGMTPQANAVEIVGSGNTLEIWKGSVIYGDVVVASGTTGNAMVLGGTDSSTFDGALIGTQYRGFESYSKDGTSTWTLTGAVADTADWTIKQGTLALSGTGSLANAGHLTANATLDISGVSGTTSVVQNLSGETSGKVVLGNKTLSLSGASAEFKGVISGAGALTITSGTQILSGNNTYAGNTTISGSATLQVGNDTATGSITGDVTNSGTLIFYRSDAAYNFSGAISGSGSVKKDGAGTVKLSGTNTYSGGTHLDGGTLSVSSASGLGTGALNFTSGTLDLAGNVSFGGGVTLGAGGGTIEANSGTNSTFSGVIGGASTLTKTGSGTLTLNGKNTYSGNTLIDGGTLSVSDDDNLGKAGGLEFSSSGTLRLTASFDSSRNIILHGIGDGGAIENSGSTITTFSGLISGSGNLIKQGSGMLVLANTNNTYGGDTYIEGGTLSISSDGSLGDASSVRGLHFEHSSKLLLTADVTSSRVITFHDISGGTIETAASTKSTFSNQITGQGALTKAGAGVLVLDGFNNNYEGTIINDGILQVSSDANLGASNGGLTFNGGMLYTTGVLDTGRSIKLNSDGTIKGANGKAVTLSGAITGTGKLTLDGGDGVEFSLTGVNSYSGGTLVTDSTTLTIGDDSSLGTTSGVLELGSEAVLALSGQTDIQRDIVLHADGSYIDTQANSVTVSGQISGGALVKSGQGSLTLTGMNIYTGLTEIDEGTLIVSKDANLGTGDAIYFDGGILQLGGAGFSTAKKLFLEAGGTIDTNGFNGVFTGVVADGGNQGADHGKLTKTGAGTLTLSGVNTYTGGTFINGGVVSVNKDSNLGAATGILAFDGGTLLLTDSFDNSRAVTLGNSGGTIQTTADKSNGFSGGIGGAGKLAKSGDGTLILSGTNTYTGGTGINSGVLSVRADSNLGDSSGGLSFDGGTLLLTESFENSRVVTLGTNGGTIQTTSGKSNGFAGVAGGTGKLTKTGGGTLKLSGINTYSGGTNINGGILSVSADSNLGAAAGTLSLGGGTLLLTDSFDNSRGVTLGTGGGTIQTTTGKSNGFSGVIAGAGKLTKDGDGTLILTGAKTYSGTTAVSKGTLQIGNGGTAGSISGTVDIATGAVLAINRSDAYTQADVIQGGGSLHQDGTGKLTITGENTFTGGTTISTGTLQIGNGGTTGSIKGDVTNGGTLAFNRSDALNFSGVFSGAGIIQQNGTGSLTLSGDSSAFSGSTSVAAGTLFVEKSLGGTVNVVSGAGLGGKGVIGGDTTIADGGTLIGKAGQVLTFNQGLTLSGNSIVNVSFGGASQNGLFSVKGALALGGTINVDAFGDNGPGVYTVFDYAGQLQGTLSVGAMPSGQVSSKVSVQSSQAGKINLVNTNGGDLTFWDGDDVTHHDDGVQSGGDGTWTNDTSNKNWTDHDFALNGEWDDSGFAIFGGEKGTVTVDNNSGAVKASGMQFQTDGYVVSGGDLTLVAPASDLSAAPIIRVGGGTNDDALTATISAKLVGTAGMRKTYLGRLILTSDNEYTGGTFVTGGVLQLGDGAAGGNGSVVGEINLGSTAANSGALDIKRSGSVTVDNDITGNGYVEITGVGEVEFTGTNSYLNGTFIRSGTLIASNDNNLGAAGSGVEIDDATLKFGADFTDINAFTHMLVLNSAQSLLDTNGHTVIAGGAISGSDGLTKTGDGTLILTYNNVYGGGTTITKGTLQIGNGGTTGTITDDVTNNGVLAFNRSDPYAFQGKISGTGSVEQTGTDTLTLTGVNDYSGGTSVKSGTLSVASNSALGALNGTLILDGGVFESTSAFSMQTREVAIGAGGGTFHTSASLTLEGALTGTGGWIKTGTGELIFGGDESAFTGTGSVQSGTVRVNGTLGGDLMAQTGAVLRGAGKISGNTTVNDGAILMGLDGNTLTFDGNLVLANASSTNVTLGTLTGTSLFAVKGNLTLGGTLNVTEDMGGFGAGVYRLFDYDGALANNGMAIDTVPGTSDETRMWIQTDYDHQVNLINQNGVEVTFWNAAGDRNQNNHNGTIVGGDGVWDFSNDNWTENDKGPQQGKLFNARWDNGSFAVFGGTAGSVAIDNQNGNVTTAGMQFATDGYVVTGQALLLDNGAPDTAPIIRVGNGQANANITATIEAELQGSGGLRKTDYGTLVLTGENSYTGGTVVAGGVLQIGNGVNTGSILGDVAISSDAYGDGTLAFNRSDNTDFTGNITGDGKGGVVQKGSGALTLSGTNTFSGGLTVENGTAKAGVAGHAFGTGVLRVKARAKADLDDLDTTIGGLMAFDATGAAGDGDIALGSGKLIVEQSFDSRFSGVISGTGDFNKSGTGALILAGANTYSGATNINGGTLKQGASGAFNATSSGYIIGTDGALDLGGFDTTLAALSNGGLVIMESQIGGQTLTVTGDYAGTGGTVVINTVLGDDNSKTDRLKIGGDSSGTTNLKVNAISKPGAQTVNGIQVVEVAGQSDGTFSLVSDYTTKDGQKAVVGGAYAYTLHQGSGSGNKDGNWYLTSQLTQEPQKPDPDPDCKQTNTCPTDPDKTRYSAGVPVYQGYVQNMQVLNKLPTLQERVGDRYLDWANDNAADQANGAAVDSRGIWARIEGAHNRLEPRSATGMKQDINSFIMQTGVDGQFYEDENGKLIAGITGQYGTAHGNSRSFFGDGTVSTRAWSVGATASWYGSDGFYVDTQGQLTWFDNDLNSGTANSRLADGAKALGYALSAEAGQRIIIDEYWSLTPQAQLVWSSLDADAFDDIWGNRIHLQDGDSLAARFGLATSYENNWQGEDGRKVSTSVYGVANIYQEFLGGSRINVADVNIDTTYNRTWAGIGGGGTYAWKEPKYALYGQVSFNTSLNHAATNFAVKGNWGFRVRW